MISLNSSSLPGFRGQDAVSRSARDSSLEKQSLDSLFAGLMSSLQQNEDQPLPDFENNAPALEYSLDESGLKAMDDPLSDSAIKVLEGTTPSQFLKALKELTEALETGTPANLTAQQQVLLREFVNEYSGNLNKVSGLQALLSQITEASGGNPQVQTLDSTLKNRINPSTDSQTQPTTETQSARTNGDRLSMTLLTEHRTNLPPTRSSDSPPLEFLNQLAAQTGSRDSATRQLQPSTGIVELRLDAPGALGAKSIATEWAPIKVETGHNQWARDLVASLGERLSMQINQQVKEATVRLDPPELGKVELIVRMDGDRLNIQLNAANGGVRDMLTQHAERLRNDFLAQNLQIVDVHVGQEGHRDQSQRPFLKPDLVAANPEGEDPDHQTAAEVSREKRWLSTSA